MKRHCYVGMLLLMAVLPKGFCTWVNLREQAEKYLRNGRYPIRDWGITGNYSFWTDNRYTEGVQPVKGTVQKITCNVVHSPSSKQGQKCAELFAWEISDGLETPFDLVVTVSLPLISRGSQRMVATLNINNATRVEVEPPKRGRATGKGAARSRMVTVKQTCHFSAPVVFDGYFVYYRERVIGDMPNYKAVPVGELKDEEKELLADGDKLMYTVKGTYEQTLCERGKPRRPSLSEKGPLS